VGYGTDDGGKTVFRRHISVGETALPRHANKNRDYSSPTLRTARKASCGMSTLPDSFHALLAFFLFFEQLRLRSDVTTVTFGDDVFANCG